MLYSVNIQSFIKPLPPNFLCISRLSFVPLVLPSYSRFDHPVNTNYESPQCKSKLSLAFISAHFQQFRAGLLSYPESLYCPILTGKEKRFSPNTSHAWCLVLEFRFEVWRYWKHQLLKVSEFTPAAEMILEVSTDHIWSHYTGKQWKLIMKIWICVYAHTTNLS